VDIDQLHQQIFRQGSTTYYNSSRLFPKALRRDISTFYAFVRVADNLVDDQPVHPEEFFAFRERWRAAVAGTPAGDWVIDPFVELSRRHGFENQWTEAFLDAMESDLKASPFDTLDDVLHYTFGSAEVIGLFMISILGIPSEARPAAQLLGRSMQFINFLRDVAEDHALGRRYLPLDGHLKDLSRETALANPQAFADFMRTWTRQYQAWQKGGEAGYRFLPWRFRVAIKTASDLYNWTARVIMKDPLEVWRRKIKPSRPRILATAVANLFCFPSKSDNGSLS